MSSRHDLRDIRKHAATLGFTDISMTNGGHWRYRHPSGAVVYGAATPSDHRTVRKAFAQLRRALRTQPAKD